MCKVNPVNSCAGHLVLPNGHVLVAGGDNVDLNPPFLTNGLQSVRDYNPDAPSYTLPVTLPTGRWYPTLVTLPDGRILIVGGSQVCCTSCSISPVAAPFCHG